MALPLLPVTALATVLATALAATPAAAQMVGGEWQATWTLHGAKAGDQLGRSVATIRDLDGDGADDFLIGARFGDHGAQQAGSVLVYSGATLQQIHALGGVDPGDFFGDAVADAGDVDGDGVNDIIVGAPGARRDGVRAGAAFVHSGATGSLLRRFDGSTNAAEFGYSVCGAGDLDGDGLGDVMIGAPYAAPQGVTTAGSVFAYSVASGALILRIDGASTYSRFGAALVRIGDIDGDGSREFAVGAPWEGSYTGAAYVHSGLDGSLLMRISGNPSSGFGQSLAGIGDLDRDGVPDLLVGAPFADTPWYYQPGVVRAHSGADGSVIRTFHTDRPEGHFGWPVAAAGDVDGDGIEDVLVGAPLQAHQGRPNAGAIYLYSGRTGRLMWRAIGRDADDFLGSALCSAGDLDGDGLSEILVGISFADREYSRQQCGSVHLLSLDPFLLPDSPEIGLASGQAVQLDLRFPTSEAGMDFEVLLSVSGTGPSIYRGVEIPLTQDGAFQASAGAPGLSGSLDAGAQATVLLSLPPATPTAAVGRTLHVAALTLDPGTLAGREVSAVRYLRIVP